MKSEICMNCADKSCYGYDHRITECEDFQPMTNADRIRGMTDEELAEKIAVQMACMECPLLKMCGRTDLQRCKDVWLSWLKSPVEVDNG